jgi:predicted AAA+ superfamily ATPase
LCFNRIEAFGLTFGREQEQRMADSLFRRLVVDEIERYLPTNDIIILHGARQVGKTSILMYLQKQLEAGSEKTLYFDLEDGRMLGLLNRGVDDFVAYLRERGFFQEALEHDGKKLFVLIDEIQYLDNPSSFLKLLADHHRYLKIIISGSSSFAMKSKFKDSLVGRTVNFEIFPLSFAEFLVFKEVPFVPAPTYTPEKNEELKKLFYEYLLYGGYPKIVLTPQLAMKERYLQQIVDTYIRKDIRDLASIKNVEKFNRLLEILASQSGNLLNILELANTCSLARETVENYLFLLEQTYVIRLVHPFSRNIRTELTKTPKVYFYDTGLMQIIWLKKLQQVVMGAVFETGIYSELVKHYGPEQVNYWRTQDKKEIDFVVRFPTALLPIEAKLHFPKDVPAALQTFTATYPIASGFEPGYRLVALEGEPGSDGMAYPWQL